MFLERKKKIFEESQELKVQAGLINCKRCGKEVVKTTKKLLYCPECRKQVIKERDSKRHKIYRELNSPIGKEMNCIVCGKAIIRDAATRRYCPECAKLPRRIKKMYRITKV